MLELVKLIKEIRKLEKELYEKYNITIINYPNDDTVVIVKDLNDFENIVKNSGFLVFDKPWESRTTYRARTIIDNIIFDFYIEEED